MEQRRHQEHYQSGRHQGYWQNSLEIRLFPEEIDKRTHETDNVKQG
jgi:hypothetical protein